MSGLNIRTHTQTLSKSGRLEGKTGKSTFLSPRTVSPRPSSVGPPRLSPGAYIIKSGLFFSRDCPAPLLLPCPRVRGICGVERLNVRPKGGKSFFSRAELCAFRWNAKKREMNGAGQDFAYFFGSSSLYPCPLDLLSCGFSFSKREAASHHRRTHFMTFSFKPREEISFMNLEIFFSWPRMDVG